MFFLLIRHAQINDSIDRLSKIFITSMFIGLVEKVEDDPFTVRLLFEPAGRPKNEFNYYLQEKNNVCVVCGAAESFIRKNVIPHEYRK